VLRFGKVLLLNPNSCSSNNELMSRCHAKSENYFVAAMGEITMSMCWDLVVIAKDKLNGVAAAIYRKPTDNECYDNRIKNEPPMCNESDDPNKAWYIYFLYCGQ